MLILQLKRFIYDKDGGLQKVMKKVNFPIDLEITKGIISVLIIYAQEVFMNRYFLVINNHGYLFK